MSQIKVQELKAVIHAKFMILQHKLSSKFRISCGTLDNLFSLQSNSLDFNLNLIESDPNDLTNVSLSPYYLSSLPILDCSNTISYLNASCPFTSDFATFHLLSYGRMSLLTLCLPLKTIDTNNMCDLHWEVKIDCDELDHIGWLSKVIFLPKYGVNTAWLVAATLLDTFISDIALKYNEFHLYFSIIYKYKSAHESRTGIQKISTPLILYMDDLFSGAYNPIIHNYKDISSDYINRWNTVILASFKTVYWNLEMVSLEQEHNQLKKALELLLQNSPLDLPTDGKTWLWSTQGLFAGSCFRLCFGIKGECSDLRLYLATQNMSSVPLAYRILNSPRFIEATGIRVVPRPQKMLEDKGNAKRTLVKDAALALLDQVRLVSSFLKTLVELKMEIQIPLVTTLPGATNCLTAVEEMINLCANSTQNAINLDEYLNSYSDIDFLSSLNKSYLQTNLKFRNMCTNF